MLMCNDEKHGMQCGYCSEFALEEHDKRIRADERAKCEEHKIEVENLVQELNSRVSELESAVAFLLSR